MRGWITTALVVTFLSGASSGFMAGRASAPELRKLTLVDNLVEDLRRAGVDQEKDIEEARRIYERFQERINALKGEVEHLFADRLTAIVTDAEGQIREIRDRYPAPTGGEKEK